MPIRRNNAYTIHFRANAILLPLGSNPVSTRARTSVDISSCRSTPRRIGVDIFDGFPYDGVRVGHTRFPLLQLSNRALRDRSPRSVSQRTADRRTTNGQRTQSIRLSTATGLAFVCCNCVLENSDDLQTSHVVSPRFSP